MCQQPSVRFRYRIMLMTPCCQPHSVDGSVLAEEPRVLHASNVHPSSHWDMLSPMQLLSVDSRQDVPLSHIAFSSALISRKRFSIGKC
jgi:hypothetical protein